MRVGCITRWPAPASPTITCTAMRMRASDASPARPLRPRRRSPALAMRVGCITCWPAPASPTITCTCDACRMHHLSIEGWITRDRPPDQPQMARPGTDSVTGGGRHHAHAGLMHLTRIGIKESLSLASLARVARGLGGRRWRPALAQFACEQIHEQAVVPGAVGAAFVRAHHADRAETDAPIGGDRPFVGRGWIDRQPMMAANIDEPAGDGADRIGPDAPRPCDAVSR